MAIPATHVPDNSVIQSSTSPTIHDLHSTPIHELQPMSDLQPSELQDSNLLDSCVADVHVATPVHIDSPMSSISSHSSARLCCESLPLSVSPCSRSFQEPESGGNLVTMQESIGLQLDTSSWIDVTRDIRASLRYCHIVSTPHSSLCCNPVSLAYTIVINRNLTWQFYVGSRLIDPKRIACLSGFLLTITTDIVIKIETACCMSW